MSKDKAFGVVVVVTSLVYLQCRTESAVFFLGLGKYAPNPAVQGDMGWVLPEHCQWICVIRQLCQMINMDNTLLSKKIFTWSLTQPSSTCRTLPYRVRKFLICIDMECVLQAHEVNTRYILSNIDSNFVPLLHQEWKENCTRPQLLQA